MTASPHTPFLSVVRIGEVSQDLCTELAGRLSRSLGLPCRVSDGPLSVDDAYDPRRGQFCSPRILERLQALADGAAHVLGVADVDLFMPVLTFVFGEAILGGRVAVMSLHRLRQSVYGLPDDPLLTLARAEREAIHELGHTFGLIHCPEYTCTMHATRSVEEIDMASEGLCPSCAGRVAEAVAGLSRNGHAHAAQVPPDAAFLPSPQARRTVSLRTFLASLFFRGKAASGAGSADMPQGTLP